MVCLQSAADEDSKTYSYHDNVSCRAAPEHVDGYKQEVMAVKMCNQPSVKANAAEAQVTPGMF